MGRTREFGKRDRNGAIHVGVNMGHDHRFPTARQRGLYEAALVDAAARTVVVIDPNANQGRRIGAPGGVLSSFALNGMLQRSAQTEASGLDVDMHFTALGK